MLDQNIKSVAEAVFEEPRRALRVLGVGKQIGRLFSYAAIIFRIARRNKNAVLNFDAGHVQRRICRTRLLWHWRLRDLVMGGLWYPGPVDNSTTFYLTLQRMVRCRPTVCWFKDSKKTAVKPCGRAHFCPFCAARFAHKIYLLVTAACNRAVAKNATTKLVYREIEFLLPAVGFENYGMPPEAMVENAKTIRRAVLDVLRRRKKLSKSLQRKTAGSLFNVVIDPLDKAWRVSIRQLILTTRNDKKPFVRIRNARTAYLKTVLASDELAVRKLIGKFVTYPNGLLYGYVELAAIALRIRHGLRVVTGTGLFTKKEYLRGEKDKAQNADAKSIS